MSKRKSARRRPLTPVEQFDLKVARAVALDKRKAPGKQVARFAELGDQPPLVLLSLSVTAFGALRRDERLARTGLRMLAAHALTTIGKLFGKGVVNRTRPAETLREGRYRMEEGASKDGQLRSMPSGHSAGVTALAVALAPDYPRHTVPTAAAAGAVMLAQLPSKNHFLSDVVAGAAIGLMAGGIARWLIPPQDAVRPPARP